MPAHKHCELFSPARLVLNCVCNSPGPAQFRGSYMMDRVLITRLVHLSSHVYSRPKKEREERNIWELCVVFLASCCLWKGKKIDNSSLAWTPVPFLSFCDSCILFAFSNQKFCEYLMISWNGAYRARSHTFYSRFKTPITVGPDPYRTGSKVNVTKDVATVK